MKISSIVIRVILSAGLMLPAVSSIHGQEAAVAAPQSVRVILRVQDGDRFVDTIGLGDLEVLENGVPQTVLGLSLTDRGKIVRTEGDPAFKPKNGRRFIVCFQMNEYDAKIDEAFQYLFNEILTENDSLTIITPQKPYQLSAQALKERPRKDLAKSMLKIVRKDITSGASEYRSLINELKRIARSIGGGSGGAGGLEAEGDAGMDDWGLEFTLPRYKQVLERIEKLRFADQNKFLAFADNLRQSSDPTQVIFFYQREFRPSISPDILAQLIDNNGDRQDLQAELNDVFGFYNREFIFDTDLVGKELADAGAPFYAMFLNRQVKNAYGIIMTEQSEDVFRIFRAISRTTGGGIDVSENPTASLKKVSALANPVYILNYASSRPVSDKSFREITVKVKDKPYTVVHRSGYFAR